MKSLLYIVFFVLLVSCGRKDDASQKTEIQTDSIATNLPSANAALKDKTVKFLWREDQYDAEIEDTISSLFIDEAYCKTVSNPEKAALGYVATFIGNECSWDEGKYTDDRSNLRCRILEALDLGYQCSDKHLGFLRKWFKNDRAVLQELRKENCPTTPEGATIQDTFDKITITVKGNEINVYFEVNGVNLREGESWNWSETDYFELEGDNIRLVKKDRSKINHEHFDQ